MKHKFFFTFANIREQYKEALNKNYRILTCAQYVELKKQGLPKKVLVNRVDVDLSLKKAERLAIIFKELGIQATFFIRLHAPEYNPFSFENYRIIKFLIQSGHEIGYHSEIIDQSIIWNEPIVECLIRDIEVMNRMFNINIVGVASHRGMTGLNNLKFWKDKKPGDFGLLYEGYDKQPEFNLFHESFYISDSEWTQWKCYNKGKLVEGDRRSLADHIASGHNLIYLLIHADTYFDEHFYDQE